MYSITYIGDIMLKKHRIKIIIIIVILGILFYYRGDIRQLEIRKFVSNIDNPYYIPIAVMGLFLLKSIVFFLPLKVIFISTGMFLPLYIAIIINFLGFILEISSTYIIGFIIGREFVERLIQKSKRFKKILDYKANNEFDLIFALRLIPVGVEPVSLFMGASKNDFFTYISASLLGMLPKLLLFTLIGDLILSDINLLKILINIILIISWLLMVKYYNLYNVFRRLYNNT